MAILANQKVLTLDYWKYANKIKVGDILFDKDGKPVKVTLVQEYRSKNCYQITFDDHLTICGDDKLRLLVEDEKYRKRTSSYKGVQKFRRPLKDKSMQELANGPLRSPKNVSLYAVQTTKPLELPHQTLPVPPFVFGFWLFGKRKNERFIASVGFSDEVQEILRDYGYKTKKHAKQLSGEYEFSISPRIETHLAPFIPHKIPNNYLLADKEQRIELLRGILHAKHRQYNKKLDHFKVYSSHLPTITQIQFLAETLGCKTNLEYNRPLKVYKLKFKSRIPLVSTQDSPPARIHYGRRFVRKIEQLPEQMCVHIETTGDDNTILVGEGFIACH